MFDIGYHWCLGSYRQLDTFNRQCHDLRLVTVVLTNIRQKVNIFILSECLGISISDKYVVGIHNFIASVFVLTSNFATIFAVSSLSGELSNRVDVAACLPFAIEVFNIDSRYENIFKLSTRLWEVVFNVQLQNNTSTEKAYPLWVSILYYSNHKGIYYKLKLMNNFYNRKHGDD